jgi:hypothetical protein
MRAAALRRTRVLALTAADWLLSKALAHARASPSIIAIGTEQGQLQLYDLATAQAFPPAAGARVLARCPVCALHGARCTFVGWFVPRARAGTGLATRGCAAHSRRARVVPRKPAAALRRIAGRSAAERSRSRPVRLRQMRRVPAHLWQGVSPVRLRQVCAELRVLSSPIRGVQWVR